MPLRWRPRVHRHRINLQRQSMPLPPMRYVPQLRGLHLPGMRSVAELRGLHLSGMRSLAQLRVLHLLPRLRNLPLLSFLHYLWTWLLGVLPRAMLLFTRRALLLTPP